MVAAMTSLVLGLLTAEVKSSYDAADNEIKQQAARLIEMNMGTREIDAPAAATIRQNLARLGQLAVAETFEGAGPRGKKRRDLYVDLPDHHGTAGADDPRAAGEIRSA